MRVLAGRSTRWALRERWAIVRGQSTRSHASPAATPFAATSSAPAGSGERSKPRSSARPCRDGMTTTDSWQFRSVPSKGRTSTRVTLRDGRYRWRRRSTPSWTSSMRDLPTGTVTFLFTDIEGSTRLLHYLGDAYADALAGHRRVLRESFARHGGVEVDTQGDAFFIAFARASDALAAAHDATEALDGPIRVRIGIHTGEPVVTDEGDV